MRSSRSVTLAALACACAVAATSCASESGSESGSGGGDGAGGTGSVSGYLELLPAGADGAGLEAVTYGDITRAAEIAGVERPGDIADTDAVVDFVMEITGQRPEASDGTRAALVLPAGVHPSQSLSDHQGFVDDVGWSILEVDSYAERDALFTNGVAVLDGDFDEDRLDETLDDAGDGVWVAGDPDRGPNYNDITPARPLGEPVWLSLDGDRLIATWNEDEMAAARGADGGDDTLAANEALAALGLALDVYDVYSAHLMSGEGLGGLDPSIVLGDEAPAEIAEQLEEFDACTGITGVATGVADDGEPLIVLAVASATEDAAEDNEALLAQALEEGSIARAQRPWSEMLDVETIGTEGNVTTITARPADMVLGQWRNLLLDRSFPPC